MKCQAYEKENIDSSGTKTVIINPCLLPTIKKKKILPQKPNAK